MTTQPPSPNRTDALLAGIAVLACLPYVALKVAWLSGSTVGLTDPDALATTSMEVANALTLGMELVALALAVALARPAGARLPAWLVGLPMYVGTGLLGGILLVVPIQTVLGLVRGPRAPWPHRMPNPSRTGCSVWSTARSVSWGWR